MRTSSPRRWIWMRIPSSFHSTEAQLEARHRVGRRSRRSRRASAGPAGRARSRPRAGRPRPPVSAMLGGAREVAGQHERAPRERRPARSAAFAIASTISPASAPCRSSPVNSRLTKSASSAVARDRSSSEQLPAPCRRAASRRAPGSPRSRASRSPTPSEGSSAGAHLDAVDRRVADADAALPRNAREEAGHDRHLVRRRAPAAAPRAARPSASASSSRRRAREAATTSASRVTAKR